MRLAPIALFVYNRPEHTRRTIDALKRNPLAIKSDLIIFSDGPKFENQIHSVFQVRNYISHIDGFNSIQIIERATNYGLANSIIDGVTMLCRKYGKVIVLEDDLETSPFFLDYMNNALFRYAKNPKVMQISGHMFDVNINLPDDAIFLPFITSWGWGTWQKKWQFFDATASQYFQIKDNRQLIKLFNLDDSYPYFEMLEAQLAGKINSWAIRWYLSVFMKAGLVLYPKKTLVNNIGFDGSGTHCASRNNNQQYSINPIVKFPKLIQPAEDVLQLFYCYFRSEYKKSFIKIFFAKLQRLAKKLEVKYDEDSK